MLTLIHRDTLLRGGTSTSHRQTHMRRPIFNQVFYLSANTLFRQRAPNLSIYSPADIIALRWFYKKIREYARRMSSFRGVFEPVHPQFSKESPPGLSETTSVPIEDPRIVYSPEDDIAIDENLRQSVGTTWHSVRSSLSSEHNRNMYFSHNF